MVWLSLFDIGRIVVEQPNALAELNVIQRTQESVFTVSDSTPKVEHHADGKDEFCRENNHGNLHKFDAHVDVEVLHLLQVLHELSLLLDEASLFLVAVGLQLFAHLLQVLGCKDVCLVKQPFYHFSI
jgi:hypothetical protein